jgi:hypothetical protein
MTIQFCNGLDNIIIVALILGSLYIHWHTSNDIAFYVCVLVFILTLCYLCSRSCIENWLISRYINVKEHFDELRASTIDVEGYLDILALPQRLTGILTPGLNHLILSVKSEDSPTTEDDNDKEYEKDDNGDPIVPGTKSVKTSIIEYLKSIGKEASDDLVEKYTQINFFLHNIKAADPEAFNSLQNSLQ